MNLMAVTMVLYVDDVYPDAVSADIAPLREIFRWAAAAFATPIMMVLAPPLARGALERRGTVASIDLLVLLSTSAAYAASLVSLFRGTGPIYFEVAAMTLLLFCVGRSIEAVAKARAATLIADSMKPGSVSFERRGDSGDWLPVRRHEIEKGDRVRVPAGVSVPVDGQLLAAHSIDRSMATGESRPVVLAVGDAVYAGDIALGPALELEAQRRADESRMARLEDSTRHAIGEHGDYERLADRLAGVLVPGALVVAILTFAYWSQAAGADVGARAALAVLLCACPCAFGIATPLALRAALARAGRRGVAMRSARDLERLAVVRAAAFDKTGTLTTKTIVVDSAVGSDPQRALAIAAALERAVRHPLGAELEKMDLGSASVEAVETVAGIGVVGRLAGRTVGIGNAQLPAHLGLPTHTDDASAADADRLWVVDGKRVIGHLSTREEIRPGASEAIAGLRGSGIAMRLLSGDTESAVRHTASRLGMEFTAGLTADEKLASIRALERESGPTMMVGDGINDAPALAASSLGVAIADGSDLARVVAPIVVDAGDLAALPWAIGLARAAMTTVRINLGWAVAYNGICVAVAASGYLPPLLAALAMALSSVSVAANSARLLKFPLDDPDMSARPRPAIANSVGRKLAGEARA
jgi:heavy metal translocating P-type ATPase